MSITSLGWDEYHTFGVGAHLSVVLVASGITIGGSIGLLFLSVIALVQRPKPRKRPVVITFFAAILSLLLLLGFCITQVILVQARLASEGYRVYGGVYGFFGPTSTVALRRAKVFFEQALMIVGDIVIIGRAKAIYPDQRWIGIGLTSLWVVTIGWGVAFYTALSIDIDHPETYYSLNKYAAIFAGLSATVNVLATTLIGYRLWSYRQFLKKEIGLRKPRYTRAQRALLVMIESGCVYRLAQLTFYLYGLVVVYTPGNASQNAVDALPIVQQIFYIVSGLYPVSLYILLSIQSRRGEHHSFIDMNITRSSA